MTSAQTQKELICSQVQVYIREEILRDDTLVDLDENLLVDGMVDSLGMLRLVGYLEAQHKLQVLPEQFTIENFRSIRTIAEFVTGLLSATHD